MGKTTLLLIDPQFDFCDPRGSLFVPGAVEDMARVATIIRRASSKIDDVHVTLDSHQSIGIERPGWWVRSSDGAASPPFTALAIHPDRKRVVRVDFKDGKMVYTDEEYTTKIPSLMYKGGVTGKGSFGYLEALEAGGRYTHVIWPMHCVIGSQGFSIVKDVSDALISWELDNISRINFVSKGSSPYTEHFGVVEAEVTSPDDPTTQMNMRFIEALRNSDRIIVAGQAKSHCVASSLLGVHKAFNDPEITRRLVVLEDCMSTVPGFEHLSDDFRKKMTAVGVRFCKSTEVL